MATKLMTVVEVPPFPDQADKIWSDKEREEFIDFMAWNPLAGDEIPGTGGLRKIRWPAKGKGKRGGARIVYFFYHESYPLYLLTVYTKGKKQDLTSEDKKIFKRLVAQIKKEFKRNF